MDTSKSEIQEFLKDKVVLVTGATGFLGKVLIEKLLRSSQVKLIYMLMRAKKGKSVEQRSEEYFDNMLFSSMKEMVDYKDRVMAIEGDMNALGLGLNTKDLELLQATVDIIFHGAATVKFNETLDRAMTINVRGTKEVLLLAKKCVNIKAFVHISTAYANCTSTNVNEELFDPPMTGDNAIQLCECLNEQQAAAISQPICGEYPNTYTFTKAIAEHVVTVYGQGLPVVIIRPAIVVSTANEPIKGWIDNLYGPTGVQVGVGAGVLRTFQVDEKCIAELVPVDMVVNATIACAWSISRQRRGETIPVYNYVSSCQNPLNWGQFIESSLRYGRQSPLAGSLWYYTMWTTRYRLLYLFYQFLLHILPALIIDSVLQLKGKKPAMMSIYKKIHTFSTVIFYFSMRKWRFDNSRVLELWSRMGEEDRKLFNFNISALDWDTFFKNTVDGLRISFFKETPDKVSTGKRKQLWFMGMHFTLMGILAFVALWMALHLYSLCSYTYNLLVTRDLPCSNS